MKPVGLYTFLLSMVVLGLFWLVIKPIYDIVAGIAITMPTIVTGVTPTEIAWFKILPFMIAGLLLIWMVVSLTKRGDK